MDEHEAEQTVKKWIFGIVLIVVALAVVALVAFLLPNA